MSFYSFSKVGTIFASFKAYFPTLIDTSDLVGWPWVVTCFSSTDHESAGNGIYLCGAKGDPTVLANWETYNTALARGAFDAFATKPAANPIYLDADISDSETPSVVRIGNQFHLTSHGLQPDNNQVTRLAIATDYPLNFVRYSVNSGRVLDSSAEPLVRFPHYNPHTGYFRWGLNALPDVPYTYVGFGLFGGGAQPNHAMYGSNDGIGWTLLTVHQESPMPGAYADRITSWNEAEPRSIRSIGNGEYVMLAALTTSAYGAAERFSDCYELTLSSDGTKVTREATLVIARGATGANDEDEVGQPAVLTYDGNILCVYQGTKNAVNSLMLAVGSFNAGAAKAAAITQRNFTTQRFNAVGGSSLPTWLAAVGTTPVPSASGLTVSGAGGIRLATDLIPDDTGWVEVYAEQSGVGTGALPIIHIGDTAGPADPANGVMAISYSSIDDTQLRARAASASALTADIRFAWYKYMPNKARVGLRWDAAAKTVTFLGYNREKVYTLDASAVPSNVAMRPGFYVNSASTSIQLAAFEVRRGATTGGVAPVFAHAIKHPDRLVFTLDKPCIGDGSGLSVTSNGVSVAGAWSRASLSELTFTRTAGEFAASDVVAVTVASTDVRSSADLVAIQDATFTDIVWYATVPTLFMAVYPATAPTPTWNRTTGWSGSPVYTDADLSPTTSGDYTFVPDSSGLQPGTDYRWYAVWDDGTTTVGPVASGTFATLSETPVALQASGLSVAAGAARLDALVSLAGIGVALAGGSGTAGAAVPLSAAGIALASGAASAGVTVRVSATGLAQAAGQAGLSAAVLLAGAGAAQAAGNATLAAQLQALASGAAQAGGSATLSGGAPGALSAIGSAQAAGQAVLSVTVQLVATGAAQASGSATGNASAPGQIAATGAASAQGSATVSVSVQLSAAGFAQAMGAGQFTASIPLAAFGQAVAAGRAAMAITNGSVTIASGPERYRVRATPRLRHVAAVRNYRVTK